MVKTNNIPETGSTLDTVVETILLTSLINPDNKDFYLKTLTLTQIKDFIDGDDYTADLFFRAYTKAQFILDRREQRARDQRDLEEYYALLEQEYQDSLALI